MAHAHISFVHRDVILPDHRLFPRLSHFGRLDGVRRDHYPLHSHPVTEFFYFMNGKADLDLGPCLPEKTTVGDEDLLIIPPAASHRFHLTASAASGISYFWFGFRTRGGPRSASQNLFWALMEGLDLEVPGSDHREEARLFRRTHSLRPVLEALHHELSSSEPGKVEMAWAHLITFFALMKRLPRKTPGENPTGGIERVVTFLRENLDRRVGLAELSDRSGLHPSSLVRSFHDKVGVPPLTWHRRARLERAKALMISGRPVTEAARETGFANLQQFCSTFKKATGFSPRAWLSRR